MFEKKNDSFVKLLQEYLRESSSQHTSKAKRLLKAFETVKHIDELSWEILHLDLPFQSAFFDSNASSSADAPLDPLVPILRSLYDEICYRQKLIKEFSKLRLTDNTLKFVLLIQSLLEEVKIFEHMRITALKSRLAQLDLQETINLLDALPDIPKPNDPEQLPQGCYEYQTYYIEDSLVSTCMSLLRRLSAVITQDSRGEDTTRDMNLIHSTNTFLQNLLSIYLDIHYPPVQPQRKGCLIL